jgi:peroxiredoxin/uncharacterized membrane protein YphA (DoxX/SURF4 family)
MTALVLIARLILSAVFGVAGVAKLADRAGSETASRNFGVPSSLAPFVARLLPLAELVLAFALVVGSSAWWAGIAALALLSAFLLGIGFNLARGQAPECHCFGQLHSEPVGWPTFARNAALTALAALIVWRGPAEVGPSAVAWIGTLNAAETGFLIADLLAAAAIASGAWFLGQLFSQHGRLLMRLDTLEKKVEQLSVNAPSESAVAAPQEAQGLPVGAPAPAFELPDLDGHMNSLGRLLETKKPALLLFVDPTCGPCTALVPDAAVWALQHSDRFTLVFVSRGEPKENRKKFAPAALSAVLLQEKYEVSERYSAFGTPSAVLVHPNGRVGSTLATGSDAIKALVARVAARREDASAKSANGTSPEIGDFAPEFRLPNSDGERVSLAEFRGHDTLVLFWNPSCGYCARMLEDIKRWERSRSSEAPSLLVVSTGDQDAIRAIGLQSPVLLDAGSTVASRFGARGTPTAVLVDAAGRVASDVAVGAQAVLSLAAPLQTSEPELPRLSRDAPIRQARY